MPDDEKKELDEKSGTSEESEDKGKVFDEKYVKELRAENKERRQEIKGLNDKIAQMEKAQAERDAVFKKSLGLKEDEEDPISVLKAKVDALTKGLEESTKNTEREKTFNAFVKEALKAGVNPDLVDDAWRLTDGVTLDNVAETVKELKERKAFLFGGKGDVGTPIQPGKTDKSYPAIIETIAQDQKQPVEWVLEVAKEYLKKHPECKNVETAALRRFGKPTLVGYKPRTD